MYTCGRSRRRAEMATCAEACRLESPPHIESHALSSVRRDSRLGTGGDSSELGQSPVANLQPQIAMIQSAQPVSDHECGAAVHQALQRIEDRRFGADVDRAGGLVQDQDRRIFQERAWECDALALT